MALTAVSDQARTVAIMDIGSNAIRLVVAQVKTDGTLEVLERLKRPVRLGHSTFLTGRLSQPVMNAAMAILRDYRRICDTFNATKIRAVATSSIREAVNSDAFLDRAAVVADFDIEVIETPEESRLTVAAVRHALDKVLESWAGTSLIVDIGGGSGLLTVLKDGVIAASESYNLGSIRLQEILGTFEEPPERAADLLRNQIDNAVSAIERTMPIHKMERFIAVGGDVQAAARAVGAPMNPDLYVLSAEALAGIVGQCQTRTVHELARIYSLPFANAETLTPALLVYQALLRASGAGSMLVPNVSMRDGLLLDLAFAITGREDPETTAWLLQSARAIGEKYHYEPGHATHVADIALRLFDSLRPVHRLSPRHRLLLQIAALLHEVGGYVSSRAHHKHSYYLISNSSLFGLRHDERELVALTARYHRRNTPRASHREYMALPRDQRMIVTKLAALLRVADALDRAHEQRIRDFLLACNGNECLITVKGALDLTLERKALKGKMDLFEDTYGMKVRLESAESAVAN